MADAPFRIGLTQLAVDDDRERTIVRHEDAIREAAGQGARIICMQELFDAPYFCKVQDAERFDLAEPMPGPVVVRMQRIAKELETVIIVPMFEKRAPGVYHNSAAVIDADGALLGIYRKMHIPDDPLYFEKYYFTPGEIYHHGAESRDATGFRTFDTRWGRIGVLICWDQWYPEGARLTALRGAEVLLYPTAIGWHPAEKQEWGAAQHDAWLTAQRAHAIANGIYVAAVNRVGHEQSAGAGIEFWGGSFVADPMGRVVASSPQDREDILVAAVDRRLIEEVRRNWPFLRDRRIDAYGGLDRRLLDE
jgi:N-carbamoylputrescine amidase